MFIFVIVYYTLDQLEVQNIYSKESRTSGDGERELRTYLSA